MTPQAPSVTTMEILPVFGQSENRSSQAPALCAELDAETSGQVYWLTGMVDTNGKAIGPNGAGSTTGTGLNTIDQTKPATGFVSAEGFGYISPAFGFQYVRAMEKPATAGTIIADHGYGGLYIRYWREDSEQPPGRNQVYWLNEAVRVADDLGVSLTCPYVWLWQGMSEKGTTTPVYRTDFNAAYQDYLLPEIQSLIGTTPKLLIVCNGADSNSTNDPGQQYMPDTQYQIAMDYGGIIVTHQRLYPTVDGNGHPTAELKALVGETGAMAASEVEAGRPWNITYSIAKSGAVVTVTFGLRSGETLLERPSLYDTYGGAATCQNYGFEADGGISSVVISGNTATVTLVNENPTWFRLARQSQDVTGAAYQAPDGTWMSAHRCTLFGSHSWPSQIIEGETIWRPVPSFNGSFVGGAFVSRADLD